MHNTFILLFFEFAKIGLFTFGGGYASLPFLYRLVDIYPWFSQDELLQLIAISGITPGPIGLNMATFCGFKTLGLSGSVVASCALLIPMIIITSQIFRLYNKFSSNKFVQSALYLLRPTSCALISWVGIKLFYNLVVNPFNFDALILVFILFCMTFRFDRSPILYMSIGAIGGIALCFLF